MTRTTPAAKPALVWFRNDLRLADHPALHAAAATGRPLLCVYVFDQESPGQRPLGAASRWWLHHTLAALAASLEAIGGRLDLFDGAAGPLIPALARHSGAEVCFWNRRYGAAEVQADDAVAAALRESGVTVETFNGTLLHEPATVTPAAGGAFKVFTAFKRASLALSPPERPLAAPGTIAAAARPDDIPGAATLDRLALLPTHPDWAGGLRETWTPGEAAAQRLLHTFLDGGLQRYADDRNRPGLPGTSRLSPHLRFGEVSPRQVVVQAEDAAEAGRAPRAEVDKFIAEVIWRDFAYNLLVSHPDLATRPVQTGFAQFPYRTAAPAEVTAWRRGRTGYPVVDAGMRQLWTTGVMHNRVRMIAASFLVKHLLIDWRVGEAWFWDTLCDADPASNPTNWQWVAGCGADPAPFFRIFNPTLQGEKFDPAGDYVRRFVPELERLPARWIHQPWEAPPDVLEAAGVALGDTYPAPLVDHDLARHRALQALSAMRAGAA